MEGIDEDSGVGGGRLPSQTIQKYLYMGNNKVETDRKTPFTNKAIRYIHVEKVGRGEKGSDWDLCPRKGDSGKEKVTGWASTLRVSN